MRTRLRRMCGEAASRLRRSPVLAFVLGGIAFLGFGVLSLNVVSMLSLNLALIASSGWMALMDGAFAQLVELLSSGYAALACYLAFKWCERIVVDYLNGLE